VSVRVVFLGPPGAGKGTQARELAARWEVAHIATGDMLREAQAQQTPLGLEARRYMEAGELVPDAVVIGLVAERLARPEAKEGFVLDGFPRTAGQAEALDRMLEDRAMPLQWVILFDVSRPELLRRLTGRRICPACGASFHLVSAPPRVAGRCDRCGGQLSQRADDTEVAVETRLDVYQRQTAPVLQYYRARGVLAPVPGEGTVEEIAARIRDVVGTPASPGHTPPGGGGA
jgi:adenylate kinase